MDKTINVSNFPTNITNNKLSFIFWNVEGIRNISLVSKSDLEILNNAKIICLCETWNEQSRSILFPLKKFKIVEALADRIHAKGRARGGLMILYDSSTAQLLEEIYNSKFFIFARFKFNNESLIIGSVYIPPTSVNDYILSDLHEALEYISVSFPNDKILVGGDFNARIGDLGEDVNDIIQTNGFVRRDRLSMDPKVNARGSDLHHLMTTISLFSLNGRVHNDIPAKFTFTAGSGRSVIDLCYASVDTLEKCVSFEVLGFPYSHHFPCKVDLNVQIPTVQNTDRCLLRWNRENAGIYQKAVKSICEEVEITEYTQFRDMIYRSAHNADLIKHIRQGNIKKQDWFDRECMDLRQKLKHYYQDAAFSSWNDEKADTYRVTRNAFRILCRKKRDDYWKDFRAKLNSCRNASDFWKVVKVLRATPSAPNVVPCISICPSFT